MGLDISYYSKIKKSYLQSNGDDDNEDECWDNADFKSDNHGFIYQLGDLENDTFYVKGDNTERGHFSAGGYSSYGQWRNELSKMAGYDSANEVWAGFDKALRKIKLHKLNNTEGKMPPFYELIWFSDCEGVICSSISKKLYKDFLDFDKKAKKYESIYVHYNSFYIQYENFKKAFKVASENGAVLFG